MKSKEWQLHTGKRIPNAVKDNVMVEVQYADGTTRKSNDFMHDDLWKPEKVGKSWPWNEVPSGYKDIVMWRLV